MNSKQRAQKRAERRAKLPPSEKEFYHQEIKWGLIGLAVVGVFLLVMLLR